MRQIGQIADFLGISENPWLKSLRFLRGFRGGEN